MPHAPLASPQPGPFPDAGLRAAAIVDDRSCDVDELLAAVAQRQRAQGRRVRGLVMTGAQSELGCAGDMVLLDVDRGHRYLVSQSLGAASTSCRADPAGFARAGEVLRRAVDEAPDLVIANRFGGLEVSGGGFRDELLALMAQDVPLLTAVAPRHVEAWQTFTGGTELLPSRADRVDDWLSRVLAPRR